MPEAEVVTDYGLQRWLGRAASVPLARERVRAPSCGDVAFRLGEGAGPRFRSRSAASTEIVRTARDLVSNFDRAGAMALMRLAGSLPEAADAAIGYLARAAQSELHYRPRNMSLAWRVGSMTRVLLLGETSSPAHTMKLEGPTTARRWRWRAELADVSTSPTRPSTSSACRYGCRRRKNGRVSSRKGRCGSSKAFGDPRQASQRPQAEPPSPTKRRDRTQSSS